MLYCVKSRSPDIKRRAAWKFNRRGGTCMGSTYMYISMYDAVMLLLMDSCMYITSDTILPYLGFVTINRTLIIVFCYY